MTGGWRPLAWAIVALFAATVGIAVATEAVSRIHLRTAGAIADDFARRSFSVSRERLRHEDRPFAVVLELGVATPESPDGGSVAADAGRVLTGTYRFGVPSGSRLMGELAAGLSDDERNDFVARYLGIVAVRRGGETVRDADENTETLRAASSEMTRLRPESPAQVAVTFEPMNLARVNQVLIRTPYEVVDADSPIPAPDTTVVVDAGKGGRVHSPYPDQPDSLSANRAVFVRHYAPSPADSNSLRFELGVDLPEVKATAGRVLGEHGGVHLPVPLGSLATGLIEALPVLVALCAVWRAKGLGRFQPTARHLIAMTLAFHVAVYTSWALATAARRIAGGLGPSTWRGTWRSVPSPPFELPSGAGGFVLLVVFGVVVWPLAATRLRRGAAGVIPPRRRWLGLAAGGLFVAAALAVALKPRRECSDPAGDAVGAAWDHACAVLSNRGTYLATLGVIAIIVVGVAVLLRLVAGPWRAWASSGAVLFGASIAVAAALFVPALIYDTDWSARVLRTVFLVFAVATVSGFAWVFARILQGPPSDAEGSEGPPPSGRGFWSVWLPRLAPALALAVLLGPAVLRVVERQRGARISPWELTSFAFALDWLLYLPPALCIVVLLRHAPEPAEGDLDANVLDVRRLGIAFLLLVAFSGLDRWFYLPLPLLLSWALVATVLLPRPSLATRRPTDGAGLRAVIEERRVTCRLRSLRQKYRSGDEVPGYEAETSALEVARRRLHREAYADGDPFLLAPDGSRWASGRRGAGYAFLLSVPSMALYLYQRLSAPGSGGAYPLMQFVGEVPLQLLQWTAYGLFLGYFYTLLRGRTGMGKAARLFVVLLVHHAFAELVSGQTEWLDVVFWGLQTFVQLVVVGLLVGDYNVARRADLSWRDLVELHDVRWAAAWASSVAVALGGVALTLLSTAAGDLYKATQEKQPPVVAQAPPPTAPPP